MRTAVVILPRWDKRLNKGKQLLFLVQQGTAQVPICILVNRSQNLEQKQLMNPLQVLKE